LKSGKDFLKAFSVFLFVLLATSLLPLQIRADDKVSDGQPPANLMNSLRRLGISVEMDANAFTTSTLLPVDNGSVLKLGASVHLSPERLDGFNDWFLDNGSLISGAGYYFRKSLCQNWKTTFNTNIATISNRDPTTISATLFGPSLKIDFDRFDSDNFPGGIGFTIYYVMIPGLSEYYNPVAGSVLGAGIRESF
jgi:hypothetical protein